MRMKGKERLTSVNLVVISKHKLPKTVLCKTALYGSWVAQFLAELYAPSPYKLLRQNKVPST